MKAWGSKACIGLAMGAMMMLSGCGSDDSSSSPGTTTLSGTVIDGYWRGARVCLDINGNSQCDNGEVNATTDNNASYTLSGVSASDVKDGTFVIAEVIAGTTVDYDPTTGITKMMDANASVMKAPSTAPEMINPFTTQVTAQIASGKSLDDAKQAVATAQGISTAQISSNYYETNSTEIIAKAQSTYSETLTGINKIGHIVVIYLENRSFDSLFNNFPGANGWENNQTANYVQLDDTNTAYTFLPMSQVQTSPMAEATYMGSTLPFPNDDITLPNQPWLMDDYATKWYIIPDLPHIFWNEQYQINGGAMNKYVTKNYASYGMSMGYNDMNGTNLWQYASDYVLCDNFFMSAFGGSFLNHQFLIAAQAPVVPDANVSGLDSSMIAEYNATKGECYVNKSFSRVPCDGAPGADPTSPMYVVNTTQPWYMPYDTTYHGADNQRVPAQTHATIGDRLMDANITWNWYAGGYSIAMAKDANGSYNNSGHDVNFQFHHDPFAYYKNFGFNSDGSPTEGRKHIKDDTEMFAAIADGSLPQVTFWKPSADVNAHPGYSAILGADAAVADVVSRIQANTALWKDAAIIITTDENGGLWDHVPPPTRDSFGPGNRIPAIIISPYANKGTVDHTQYDTTSILAFIEKRFGLEALVPSRDGNISNLTNAFNFDQ